MTEAFKRLNAKIEALLQENAKLMEQVKLFKDQDSNQKIHTSTQTSESSFSSQDKMDEQGVHSPTNAKRSTVSNDKDTASPVQMVAGKDTSNPFMAVTLLKSEDEGSSSRRRLLRSFTQLCTTLIPEDERTPVDEQGKDNNFGRNKSVPCGYAHICRVSAYFITIL
uniref:Uncharacterized protein n=1 Tax=Solanum tuberosum TaxID=4113 RepID=M1B9S0_SOLTU